MRVTLLAAAILCGLGTAASAQPGMPDRSAANALSGAMRNVGSPWLHHAISDVGTNPTGWKRQWCAKSMNMWLRAERQEGLRRQHRHLLPARGAQAVGPASRRHRRDEAPRRHRERGEREPCHPRLRQPFRQEPAPAVSASANMRGVVSSPMSGPSSVETYPGLSLVMAGLVPATHVFSHHNGYARHKAGHDDFINLGLT